MNGKSPTYLRETVLYELLCAIIPPPLAAKKTKNKLLHNKLIIYDSTVFIGTIRGCIERVPWAFSLD